MCFKRQRKSSSSSSSPLGYINEDLVTIISLYLPVRSILRFRSVSKKWYSLLTHTHFIHRYASNTSRKSSLFLTVPYKNRFFFPLKGDVSNFDFGFDFTSVKKSHTDFLYLKRSCHGLLLFYTVRGPNQPGVGECTYYICNPSTRNYTQLAIPDFLTKDSANASAHLAFDPSESPHYKVIFFWNDRIDRRSYLDFHITIYSSETRTCKTLGSTFYNKDSMALNCGVFLNGAILCVSCPFMITTPSIFYFDINQETFRTFPGPPIASRTRFFGACRGRLHLILSHHREHVFDVYELKEDFSSWFVKYKVDLHAIAAYFPEILIDKDEDSSKQYSNPSFCCFLEKHEEEDPTIVLTFENHRLPIAYNLIDKTARKLFNLPASYEDSRWFQNVRCIESLFCV